MRVSIFRFQTRTVWPRYSGGTCLKSLKYAYNACAHVYDTYVVYPHGLNFLERSFLNIYIIILLVIILPSEEYNLYTITPLRRSHAVIRNPSEHHCGTFGFYYNM